MENPDIRALPRRSGLPATLMTLLGILWLGVFPLACDFTYAHITEAKWWAMWIGVGLTVPAAFFALGWRRAAEGCRPRLPALILAAALLGWMTVTAFEGSWADTLNARGQLVTIWGDLRFEGLLAQLGYTLIFLCMSFSPLRLRRVGAAAAVALTLFTLLAVWQYTDTNPLGLYPEGYGILHNYEFQSTIGNIDMVAGYLALVVPLALLPWLLRGGRGAGLAAAAGMLGVGLCLFNEVQAGYFSLLALGAVLLYFFLTRRETRPRCLLLLGGFAALLLLRRCVLLPWLDGAERVMLRPDPGLTELVLAGLAAAGLAAFLLLRRFSHPATPEGGMKPRTALLLLAGLAVLALVLLAVLPVPEGAGGLWEIHETLLGRGQDSFGSERLGAWRIAWDMALDHPIVGIGPDTFNVAAEGYMADAWMVLEQSFDTPHNIFLGYLYGSGFPGLILYLALLGAVLHRCRRGGEPGAVLGAALLCYLAQGCFTFSICLVSPMAWAVMGMAAALPDLRGETSPADSSPADSSDSSPAKEETPDAPLSAEA